MEAFFFSNHSANQNAGTTKMLPPSGEEGHSSNENVELKYITTAQRIRMQESRSWPDP